MTVWLEMSVGDKIISIVLLCLGLALILAIIGVFAKVFSIVKVGKDGVEFKSKKKDGGNSRPTLLKHRFFQLMDTVKIDGFIMPDSPDTDKKIINVTFLRDCLFASIEKSMKDFFRTMENTKGKELYMLPSVLLSTMSEYADKAKSMRIILNNSVVIYGVPTCYIGRFNSWNYEHHRVLMESIQDVISDAFYSDWYMKCVACLDYLYNCYVLTIYDANRTLGQLNGNLEAEIGLMVENQQKEEI